MSGALLPEPNSEHFGTSRKTSVGRPQPSCSLSTWITVELLADILQRVGLRYEILGFTTDEWHGGQSRKRWHLMGSPPHPGRLNDILRIIYRDAAASNPGAPYALRHLLRNTLLKENIDGEALFWASERLKAQNTPRNVLITLSDGAPVDDSTLNENPPDFLMAHLEAVIHDLHPTPGITLAGIGIDHDLAPLYPHSLKFDRMDQLPATLPPFLTSLLI